MINRLRRTCSDIIHYGQLCVSWIILHTVRRTLLNQDIWLIREKRDEARDNGYHFYKYVREKHPDIHAYYVITDSSPDRYKVEKYGNLIKADSWKHCIYFLAAKNSINSQQYGAYPFRFSRRMMKYVQKLCNPKQKVVFLQHGIIKDKFPLNAFLYGTCNIDFFVTSSKREYEFIKNTYRYPDYAIGCVGLARYDNLHIAHPVEKQVLVMPTWRQWLSAGNGRNQNDCFLNSDYFKAYSDLLSDRQLIQELKKHEYKLVFYMHYKLQPYVNLFNLFENDVILIADKEHFDVQELLMSSQLMITDYSSVFFDFAYMNKPLLYYQFDKEEFRKRHYEQGYFSYEKDGFGPCFEDWEAARDYVLMMLDNDCQQPAMYESRVIDFFDVRDNRNCERIYNAILTLENI